MSSMHTARARLLRLEQRVTKQPARATRIVRPMSVPDSRARLAFAERIDLDEMTARVNAHADELVAAGEAVVAFHPYRNDALAILTTDELERLEALLERCEADERTGAIESWKMNPMKKASYAVLGMVLIIVATLGWLHWGGSLETVGRM